MENTTEQPQCQALNEQFEASTFSSPSLTTESQTAPGPGNLSKARQG